MSVIASNSVNFVPICQLLKNVADIKPKEIFSEQIEEKSAEIFDSVELSSFHKIGQEIQPNSIFPDRNIEKSNNAAFSERISEVKQVLVDSQFVLQNADSVRSFILESKERAMAQQANQSKQNAIVLI
jgi:hypothetical protein